MRMVLHDFSGGLDMTGDAARTPENAFSQYLGVSSDRKGRLLPGLLTSGFLDITTPVYKMFRFQTAKESHVFSAGWDGTNNIVYYHEGEDGAQNAINVGTAIPGTERFDPVAFAQSRDRLYIADPWGTLKVWWPDIPGGDAVVAGLAPPASVGTYVVSGVGTGNLNTDGLAIPYYQWKLTYVSVNGDESNGSPASSELTFDDQNITWTIANPNQASGKLLIEKGRIYRRGGIVENWVLAGEVSFEDPASPGYALSETFLDSQSDLDLGTTTIPTNNFRFPLGLNGIATHKERLFAFSSTGYGSQSQSFLPFPNEGYLAPLGPQFLWYSSFNHMEMTGNGSDTDASDGGFIQLPGADGDGIVALASAGSVLIIGRRRSVYALFGNSHEDFALSQRANVGVAGRNAMCRGYNDVYFLGSDKRVYRLGEGDPQWISAPIQEILDAQHVFDVANAHLVFADSRLLLVFGAQTNLGGTIRAFVLDLKLQPYWSEVDLYKSVPHADDLCVLDVIGVPPYDSTAIPGYEMAGLDHFLYLIGTNDGLSEVFTNGDEIQALRPPPGPTLVSGNVNEVRLSKEILLDGEFGGQLVRAQALYLEGMMSGDYLALRVQADDAFYDIAFQGSVAVETLLDVRLPGHLVGRRLSVTLIGDQVDRLDIRTLRLDYDAYRSHP